MPSLSALDPNPDEDDGIDEASSKDEEDGPRILSLSGMADRKDDTGALIEPDEDEPELEEPEEPEELELPDDEEPPNPSGVVGLICCSLVSTLIFFTMIMF